MYRPDHLYLLAKKGLTEPQWSKIFFNLKLEYYVAISRRIKNRFSLDVSDSLMPYIFRITARTRDVRAYVCVRVWSLPL